MDHPRSVSHQLASWTPEARAALANLIRHATRGAHVRLLNDFVADVVDQLDPLGREAIARIVASEQNADELAASLDRELSAANGRENQRRHDAMGGL